PLRSEAPTTATDLGRSRRSICWLVKRRSLIVNHSLSRVPVAPTPRFVIPADAGTRGQSGAGRTFLVRRVPAFAGMTSLLKSALLDLRLVESAEARLEGLVVEELLGGFLAGFPAAEVVERFLRADQVVLGVVVGHLANATDGPLGGAQRMAVLLLEHVGDFLDARLELVGRQRLVDHALFGGLLARQVLAHHRVVHRVAEAHELGRDLGGTAAGQDRPVDLGEAELRVVRAEREVTGEQRAVGAAEAPAVDHADRRLLVPPQPLPPAISLALRLAGGVDAF